MLKGLVTGASLAAVLCLLGQNSAAQTGRVMDDCEMKSEILGMTRKYAVYLPPDYDHSQRSYPVLYLLHGSGDDQSGWVQFGEVLHIADRAIREGHSTPMVIVMPDGDTGRRGYFNDIRGDWRYEDFFFDELMPHVEQEFRIRQKKRYRAIAGLSMGGGGTFMYALHRPDLFAAACPLSASTGPIKLEDTKRYTRARAEIPAVNVSDDVLQEYFERHSATELIKSLDPKSVASVDWYIDCGDDDFLYEGNSLVHVAMKKAGIPHEYRVRDGAHNWTYWRQSLPEVLHFVSQRFHQY
ncbi:MAG TPA: 1,4-beta-xylanase [Planctomycetaceae bacterium]|nr:1,4-beta-xylanase [Planctomycetaceae bacterium]